MRAAICYEFGQPLVVEEVELDPPQQGEVMVRLAATAICHSDVHFIRGEWGRKTPVVVGHEGAGIIEAIGPDVTTVRPGDAVVVTLLRACGACFYCVQGAPFHCEGDFPLNHEQRMRNKRGEPILQGLLTGAFAEYTIVHESQVLPLPDDIPLESAALLACGVITGLGAVVNTAQIEAGSSVVVIGLGGVGLNAVQGAAISGAYPLLAVDILDEKLELAHTFGATHTANAAEDDVVTMVKELTGGRGADYAFVTVGSTRAAEQAIKMIRPMGTAVLVGLPKYGETISVPAFHFGVGSYRLVGSLMGSTRLSTDVPKLVDLYRAGRLKLDELITARYPLDRINEAIEEMETGRTVRNVIIF